MKSGGNVMYDSSYEIIPPEHDKFMLRLMEFKNTVPMFPMHWHGHTEFLYIIDGEAEIYINGQDTKISKGDFVIVNTNELHRGSIKEGKGSYLCLMLPPAFFDAAGSDIRYIFKNHIRNDEHIKKLMTEIFSDKENRFITRSRAYALVCYLAENHCYSRLSRHEYAQQMAKHETFNGIIDRIEQSYTEPLTTKELARSAHLSETYFCHLFKRCMGQTVSEYITELRMGHAVYLISNSKMTITEIASQLGYNDVNYFCRLFKRRFEKSPGEYRKQLAN